jgi:DNA-binding response OmpR family regulator
MTQMQGEATTTNQSPSPPASSLLVVDDNSMNRIMLSRYISKLGPVIMISAAEELESVVRCIELGAQDYLPKPFNPVLLRARLSECLERKRMRDQEIDYLQQVGRVTAAAAIRANTFQAGSLDEVARCSDELGQLAQVFQEMARQVSAREQHLQRQVQQLRIEIDQKRRAREVADITESEYFQQLLGKAEELRHRIKDPEEDGMQENAAKELEPGA